MIGKEILKYAESKSNIRQAWIGLNPQFNMDIIDIESCTNFRLAPNLHGQFDIVWIYEKMLSEYHILSWKIVLDECTRLLKEHGQLIIRMQDKEKLSIPMIKAFLGRNINLEVSLDNQYFDKETYTYTIVFNITRLNFDLYEDKSWTFAMLTSGKKDDIVVKFLESIRNNEHSKSQIIISGPQKELYDKYDVEYLDLSNYRDDKYPEISKKKNDIAKMAKKANLLIAHDRYYLDKNFFNDFEKYGYDWDFLAIKQISDIDNKEYPSYSYLYGEYLVNSHPGVNLDYDKLPIQTYCNGGVMIFKTHNLQKLKFNDLLFWNEREDIEISHEFIIHSLIPRYNFLSILYTNRRCDEFPFDILKNGKIKYCSITTKSKKPNLYGLNYRIPKFRFIYIKMGTKPKFPFIKLSIKLFRKV